MKRHGCSRSTAYLIAAGKPRMRIQSSRAMSERGLDPYFTCPEATISLLYLERAYLPRAILDPCAGDGAITKLMAQHGYETYANDIEDYGLEGCSIGNYLATQPLPLTEGIVTNPPYKLAVEFLLKAIGEADYVALLVRSMFLIEAESRDAFFEEHPPVRVYHSSQRLPRMHHIGWTGRRSSSQTPYSWAVWDRRANHVELPRRYRWRDIWTEYQAGRLDLGP
jgi:hypothetical protein